MTKKGKEERNGENVEGDEPNFDDPEDFVDDVSEQGEHSLYFRQFSLKRDRNCVIKVNGLNG